MPILWLSGWRRHRRCSDFAWPRSNNRLASSSLPAKTVRNLGAKFGRNDLSFTPSGYAQSDLGAAMPSPIQFLKPTWDGLLSAFEMDETSSCATLCRAQLPPASSDKSLPDEFEEFLTLPDHGLINRRTSVSGPVFPSAWAPKTATPLLRRFALASCRSRAEWRREPATYRSVTKSLSVSSASFVRSLASSLRPPEACQNIVWLREGLAPFRVADCVFSIACGAIW